MPFWPRRCIPAWRIPLKPASSRCILPWLCGCLLYTSDLSGRKCRRDFGGGSTASAGFSVRGSYMQDSENGLVPGTRQKAERGKLLSWNHTSCRHLPVGHFDGKHFKSGSAADISWNVVRKNGKRVLHIVL